MSTIAELEVSGKKDLGCITPEEIVRFCIDHDVDRINHMHCLYKVTQKLTQEEIGDGFTPEELFLPIDCVDEYPMDKYDWRQQNIWEIDYN